MMECVIVVAPIMNQGGKTSFNRFINSIVPLFDCVNIISGNFYNEDLKNKETWKIKIDNYCYKPVKQAYIKHIMAYLYLNIIYAIKLISKRKRSKFVFFYNGYTYIIPMTISKLLRYTIINKWGGSQFQVEQEQKNNFSTLTEIFERLSFLLSDYIIVFTDKNVTRNHLDNFRKKIIYANEQYVDTEHFLITNPPRLRKTIIGYVGRISYEKGIINLIHSVPLIINKYATAKFLIIGDGPEMTQVKQLIFDLKLKDCVDIKGWIEHEELPSYFNEIKLLIIPSYTEGLPNTMLEAMACGSVVLATKVGSIDDIIIDGNNGFLLDNNIPSTIADRVIEILGKEIESIAYAGRRDILKNFSFEKSLHLYHVAFQKILSKFK